jgi:hypothetical protein
MMCFQMLSNTPFCKQIKKKYDALNFTSVL